MKLILPLYVLFFFVLISLLNSFSSEKAVDSFFFGAVIFLFHYTFLAFNRDDGEKGIRYLVLGLSLIVLAGFFIEALLGFQLVSGNEELTVTDKAFKGFFFNTNDQAVIMISLAVLVGFFFIIRENGWKVKLTGYALLLIIGLAIVVSASRSVLLSYLIMMMLILFLNASVYFKAVYLFFACVIALFVFNLSWLQELFIMLAKIDWLERPIERFSLVIFSMADDKSVGYRTEIYTAFLDNFKILWLGYGPRDYIGYFDQIKLSFPLGYTNPHSFFIEVYLAFGIFAFFAFLYFILYSVYYVLTDYLLAWKERIFILFIFVNFCWIVWVPSSVLRLPLVWYPLFLVLVYAVLVRNGTFTDPKLVSSRRVS
ncbi:O-antigen ligase family protein [Actinobacillus succinogenes]|uniref:O-antigen ligase family protein n=1 Tax=Actinobacillus succinogenes TaxID=67854 RepID=UPI0002EEA045|nr:O-antigen ligase family protein [Actinobacillus succinogenes]